MSAYRMSLRSYLTASWAHRHEEKRAGAFWLAVYTASCAPRDQEKSIEGKFQ
jgi:hypothetical protein